MNLGEKMFISKLMKNLGILLFSIVVFAGCSFKEALPILTVTLESKLEIPSLENEVNRVAGGMSLVRINSAILNMPISSNAKWPNRLNDSMSNESKNTIKNYLKNDPYVLTYAFTEEIQKKLLGGGYNILKGSENISTLTYIALNRVNTIYVDGKWPKFFDFYPSLNDYHVFKDGEQKKVEAVSGNSYQNISFAVISLMPTNFQKDLELSYKEMERSFAEVASLKAQKDALDIKLKISKKEKLTLAQEEDVKSKIFVLNTQVKIKEEIATQKEEIYIKLMDNAIEALGSDIRYDEDQLKLAKNILLISKAITSSAGLATGVFGLSAASITSRLQNFDKEIASYSDATVNAPKNIQTLLSKRLERIIKNSLYALPSISIGTYYAMKQYFLASKYEEIANIFIDVEKAEKELATSKSVANAKK